MIRNGLICLIIFVTAGVAHAQARMDETLVPKFELKKSGLQLDRRTQAGSFFDVVGHRSVVLGYENRTLEAWVYPLKILDDFELSFRIEGYPLEFRGPDIEVKIDVRPEATVFTYSHAAFTVRQITYAPVDEPGIIILLEVQTVLPMTVTGSFRPRLKLGWPAALDMSVMPYQEEPRDVPIRFDVQPSMEALKSHFIPIVIAGSVEGRDKAKGAYNRLLTSAQTLYEKNVAYYSRLQNETTTIKTPDERLDQAFQWAKVGIDKGLATNPFLGTGLVAGFG